MSIASCFVNRVRKTVPSYTIYKIIFCCSGEGWGHILMEVDDIKVLRPFLII